MSNFSLVDFFLLAGFFSLLYSLFYPSESSMVEGYEMMRQMLFIYLNLEPLELLS